MKLLELVLLKDFWEELRFLSLEFLVQVNQCKLDQNYYTYGVIAMYGLTPPCRTVHIPQWVTGLFSVFKELLCIVSGDIACNLSSLYKYIEVYPEICRLEKQGYKVKNAVESDGPGLNPGHDHFLLGKLSRVFCLTAPWCPLI